MLLTDLVPRHWTPQQAVQVNELLWRLQAALWTVHGVAMDAELAVAEERQIELPYPMPASDEIPF